MALTLLSASCAGAYAPNAVWVAERYPLKSAMRRVLSILDALHQSIEEAWFHSDVLSEEEAYRRFVQQ